MATEPADWRTGKNAVSKRLAYLLETGDDADVHFLVGKPDEEKELISVHKLVLKAASRVFESQFFRHGNSNVLVEEGSTKEKPILLTDISADAFRAMLKQIYADDFGAVNKQNVMGVYYAGKKYMIDDLVDQCRQSIMDNRNLDEQNALAVLKHAQHYEDKALIGHCWEFVDSHTNAVLQSEQFLELEQADLCELFKRNTLQSTELKLFQMLHEWAINKCTANGLEPTPENKRNAVGKAIDQIRFPLITHQEFTKHIVPTDLLSKDDMLTLYVHYSGEGSSGAASRKYPNRFKGEPRGEITKLEWNNNKWHISDQEGVQTNADELSITKTIQNGEWTAVRAQQPISRAMLALIPGQKLVYWEVTMKKKRAFGIGWVGPNVPLNDDEWIGDQPGSFSIDHMGDYWELGGIVADGYGKGFDEGDVVGSGLLLKRDDRLKMFFTRNGALNGLPIVLEDSADLLLYPTVGICWKDTSVEANFGADSAGKPFKFDVNAREAEFAFGIGWVGPNVPLNDDEWIGDQPGSFSIDHMGDYWELGGIVADGYGKGFDEGDVVGSGLLLKRDDRLKMFFTRNGALNGLPIVLEDSADLFQAPPHGRRLLLFLLLCWLTFVWLFAASKFFLLINSLHLNFHFYFLSIC